MPAPQASGQRYALGVLMLVPCIVVLIGVIIGWYTVSGSDIHVRPYGRRERYHGESPLDDGFDMAQWSRGTQSSRSRKR